MLVHDFAWLSNPEVFAVNRLAHVSDHKINEAKKIDLDGIWFFSYAENPQSIDFLFLNQNPPNTIKVPAHMQLQGYGKPHYVNTQYPWDGHEDIVPPHIPSANPVGCYTKTFEMPNEFYTTHLVFEGVESAFYVWVNGVFIGYSENSFSPARFDITAELKGGENRVSVAVMRFCSGSWLEDQDFWRFSGIFRSTYALQMPSVFVQDVQVKAEPNQDFKSGVFNLVADISNAAQEITTTVCVYDCNNNLVIKEDSIAHVDSKVNFECTLANIQLWSAETPYLYALTIQLYDGKNCICTAKTHFGFRKFELKNGVMLLNGKRIVFKGINRHEFNCKTGRAISKQDMEWDVKTLKELNFNAVRTSHYPNQSYFYELCDIYGLYVIDEANIESHGSWMVMGKCVADENTVPADNPAWKNCVLDRAGALLERDKNHPCVLFWSCGNESYGGGNLFEVAQYFKKRDPSRLVHYEGIFWDRRFPDTSDVESRMYAKPHEVEEYVKSKPSKPMILCEYSHAMGNSCGNLFKYWELIQKYEQFQGGFIWDFIDQAIETKNADGSTFFAYGGDFFDRPTDLNFCCNGIVLANRVLSPKCAEIKFLQQPVNMTPSLKSITIQNNNLFVSTQKYTFVWKLLQNGTCIQTGSFMCAVPPQEQKPFVFEQPLTCPYPQSEYVLDCSMIFQNAEIAFNQSIVQEKTGCCVQSGFLNEPNCCNEKAHIIEGDVNIGVDFTDKNGKKIGHALISKVTGALTGFVTNGTQKISVPLMLDFWRAPTDNDRGNNAPVKRAFWKTATLYQYCSSISVSKNDATVVVEKSFPAHSGLRAKMTYTFYKSGCIRLAIRLTGFEKEADMPCFGYNFAMPYSYQNIEWYGNTQIEASNDRESGARLGIANGTVFEQYIPYSKPQDCGSKTKVRYVSVTDSQSNGLTIHAPKPFECSVLPYTSHQIEEAHNSACLPPVRNTIVGIYAKKSGVGGDDSWGAPVHPEFLCKCADLGEFVSYLL